MMIELKNVSKNYGNHIVLKNINMKISTPGFYVIKGKSGCGKSSLLNILSLVDDNYMGSFYFAKKNVNNLSKEEKENLIAANVTYLFQDPKLIEGEDIKTNLQILSYKSPDEKYLKDLLLKVGLNKSLDTDVSILSKGERQRLMISIALLKDTPLVLLDEITSGLDENNKSLVLKIVKEMSKTKIIILVTHDISSVSNIASHIFILEEGRMEDINISNNEVYKINKLNNKLDLSYFLLRSKRLFKKNRIRYLCLIITLVICMFTMGLSLMTNLSLSSGIKKSLSSSYNFNQLIVKDKKEKDNLSSLISVPKTELEEKCKDYSSTYYSYYFIDYDNFFVDKDYFSLKAGNNNLKLENYNFKTLNNYINVSSKSIEINPKIEILEDDEVILGLPYPTLSLIARSLRLSTPYEDTLKMYLMGNTLELTAHFTNYDWGYDISIKFLVKGFFVNSKPLICHTSSTFLENILEGNIMQLPVAYNLKDNSYSPWTIKKAVCYEVNEDEVDNFFVNMMNDEKMNNYSFHLLSNESPYINLDNNKTKLIYLTYKNKSLNLSDFNFLNNEEKVENYLPCGPNSYYVDEQALLSGFYMPTYLSSSLESTNEFIDYNSFSSSNLGAYQSSLIHNENDDFFSLSLLDSAKKNYLRFVPYLNKNHELLEGRYPSNYNEIIISSALKEKLKLKEGEKTVYLTRLINITSEGDKYKNNFMSLPLQIVGTIESSSLLIKQDNLFPLVLEHCKFNVKHEDQEISSMLVTFKENASSLVSALNEKYPEYIFYSPLENYLKEMNNALSYLSIGLMVFSLIVMISNLFLNILINYLLIGETKKEMAIYRFNGYCQKSNYLFYLVFNSIMVIFSVLITSGILIFTNFILPRFNNLFAGIEFNLIPYLSIMVLGGVSIGLTMLFSYLKYSKMNIIKEIKEN
jgi:putative ABC transport system ATP-binding protein